MLLKHLVFILHVWELTLVNPEQADTTIPYMPHTMLIWFPSHWFLRGLLILHSDFCLFIFIIEILSNEYYFSALKFFFNLSFFLWVLFALDSESDWIGKFTRWMPVTDVIIKKWVKGEKYRNTNVLYNPGISSLNPSSIWLSSVLPV